MSEVELLEKQRAELEKNYSDEPEWGTKEWNESHFPNDQLDSEGDTWGMRWRGMEKMRSRSYLKLLKDELNDSEPLKILDIGCALCDFTVKAWDVNRNNQFSCMDISDNAIAWVTKKYPMFSFKVGAIPDIPFDDNFDMIFLLEVLCYANADDRRKTIENIHNILAPSGKLVFSGVINAGPRHHTAEEVFELLGNNFEIRQIIYNHWMLHQKLIDNPLQKLRSVLLRLLSPLEMSNDGFQEWISSRDGGARFKIIKILRLANPVSIWLVRAIEILVKLIIGSRLLAVIFSEISKLMGGSKNADEMVVLAVKK